jgi:hypothetical protein
VSARRRGALSAPACLSLAVLAAVPAWGEDDSGATEPLPSERGGGAIEPSLGAFIYVVEPWVAVRPGFVSVAYTYRFSSRFSLGGWLGVMPEGTWFPFLPTLGVRASLGDKVHGVALLANLGFPPSIGLYIRNRFVVVGWLQSVYVELGYSFPLPYRRDGPEERHAAATAPPP